MHDAAARRSFPQWKTVPCSCTVPVSRLNASTVLGYRPCGVMSSASSLLLQTNYRFNLACCRLTVGKKSCCSEENEFLVAKRILKMLVQNMYFNFGLCVQALTFLTARC